VVEEVASWRLPRRSLQPSVRCRGRGIIRCGRFSWRDHFSRFRWGVLLRYVTFDFLRFLSDFSKTWCAGGGKISRMLTNDSRGFLRISLDFISSFFISSFIADIDYFDVGSRLIRSHLITDWLIDCEIRFRLIIFWFRFLRCEGKDLCAECGEDWFSCGFLISF